MLYIPVYFYRLQETSLNAWTHLYIPGYFSWFLSTFWTSRILSWISEYFFRLLDKFKDSWYFYKFVDIFIDSGTPLLIDSQIPSWFQDTFKDSQILDQIHWYQYRLLNVLYTPRYLHWFWNTFLNSQITNILVDTTLDSLIFVNISWHLYRFIYNFIYLGIIF